MADEAKQLDAPGVAPAAPAPEATTSNDSTAPATVGDETANPRDDSPAKSSQEDAPAAKPTEPTRERSKLEITVIMLALCMALFIAALDVTVVTTALPTITEYFQSASGYQWIGSAYLLAACAATPSWGKLSDIWGRKPIIQTAILVFFLGSALCGWATNINMLIGGRAVQGIGGGGLIILPNICVSDIFSMRTRPAFFALIGATWAIASGVGPIIGGALTQRVSWRWCFLVNLPVIGVVFFVVLFFLKLNTPKTPLVAGLKAIDWLGSISIVGGTLMLLLGLEFGGETHPWNSAIVICLIVFGLLMAVIFAVIEWKVAQYPVIPLRIFSNRSNLAALGVCFCHGFVFISGLFYLPLYFQAVLGAGALLSGVYLLPLALTLSFSSAATGIIIRKTGRYLEPIWLGMAIMTLGFGLILNLDADSSWAKIILYQMVAGLGIGPNFQSPLIALQAFISPRDIGTATATFGFTRNLSTAIGIVVGGVIFQNSMAKQSAQLAAALGPKVGSLLSGGGAGANVALISTLTPAQQTVVRAAFVYSLHRLWYIYIAMGAVGLLISFLIRKKTLDKTHHETPTGLQTRAEAKAERHAAKAARDKPTEKAEV
ncbi:MAG: hypothetical protein M1838_000208 [Thelocarpon superellum]|nr:MAG: hypothetical protein M1838_000208 [Thelocarpon superellum]